MMGTTPLTAEVLSCAPPLAGSDATLVTSLARVRNALDLRIARAILPKDEVAPDRMLKALRNVRVGNFVALRLLHLLDRPDAGTADEPLKGIAAEGRAEASLRIAEAFEVLKDAVLIASPETVGSAMPFFAAFRKKLATSVRDGAPWDNLNKYYRSIVKKISAPSRRFFAGDGGGHVGASFDPEWIDAPSTAKEELERSITKSVALALMQQQAGEKARGGGGNGGGESKAKGKGKGSGGAKRETHEPDPNSARSLKKARSEKGKSNDAAGTRYRGTDVKVGAAVNVPAIAELKKWEAELDKAQNITHDSGKHPCWMFWHPQGCPHDGDSCRFSHSVHK